MTESNPETKPKTAPKLQYKIETANGVYVIRRPMGRAGARHFALMQKCMPSYVDEETGTPVFSEADKERMGEAFETWCGLVLPSILIDGPFKPDEMPGEDQYAMFAALLQTTISGVGPELFRIID